LIARFFNSTSRLEKMVDILSSFASAGPIQLFSHDLNEIVLQSFEHHQKTTKKTGQGLALASCRKNLLDMGGDIEVASDYGKGTTFILTIPREYSGRTLAVDPVATVIQGKKVERIYRD
jgi:light-regulated signal transduction histidine kinase (bacteriophytochrome)